MKKGLRVSEKRISLVKENLSKLEEKTGVKITVKGLQVMMEGESLKVWKTKDIVDAIGKGFSFKKSLKLLNEESQLKIVQLKQITSSRSSIDKIKGRIIGRGGRTRELIEEYSGSLVSVYEDYVSIIGMPQEIAVASKAIQMLINGSPHAKVYHYLEQNQPNNEIRR